MTLLITNDQHNRMNGLELAIRKTEEHSACGITVDFKQVKSIGQKVFFLFHRTTKQQFHVDAWFQKCQVDREQR